MNNKIMSKQHRANFLTSIIRIEIHLRQARQRDRGGERSDESVNRDVYTLRTVRVIRTSSQTLREQ